MRKQAQRGRARPSTYQAALERLARRDYSGVELSRALRRAGHPKDAIAQALDRLRAQRALDDVRFATGFARGRLAYHGLGRNRIRAALRQRGVAREVVEEGLKQALSERSEQDVLDAVARRLLGREHRDDPRKRLLKVFAALVRRGFPPSQVRQRLVMLRKEAGDILDGYQFEAPEPSVDPEGDPD